MEHHQYGNRRSCFPQVCLQDQESKSEQTCSRAWGWAPFGGSPGFLNLGRSSSSGQWQVHPTPGSVQNSRPSSPRALYLDPQEADGTGRPPPRPSSCPEHSRSRPSLGRSRDGGVPCGKRTRSSLCTWTSTPGMWVGGTWALGGADGGLRKQGGTGGPEEGVCELCLCQASDSTGLPSPGHWGGGAEQRWCGDHSRPQALPASALQVPGLGA